MTILHHVIMTPAIRIAIIISAITLIGMAGMAVNYSPRPAHADLCKGWLFPHSQGQICYQTKKECNDALQAQAPGTTLTCTKSKK